MELKVQKESWLAGRTLQDLQLPREGVLVLGITHADRGYEGAPRGDMRIQAGDTLVLYGRSSALAQLGRRRTGPQGAEERARAVEVEREVEREQAYQSGSASPAGRRTE